MKKLEGLNAIPELSESHKEAKETGQQVLIRPIKRMLRDAIATSMPKSIENAEEKDQLRLKLMLEEDTIDLEDAQYKLLKEIVEPNPCGWTHHYYSQVAKVLVKAGK